MYADGDFSRMVRNPKMLIAFVILIAFGVYMDVYVLHARGNPLPDPDNVKTVSFIRAGAPVGSQAEKVDIARYRELYDCLDGFERVMHSGTGELVGTIVIKRTKGSTARAELYEYGLVRTEDGLFLDHSGDRTNEVCAVIRRLRGA